MATNSTGVCVCLCQDSAGEVCGKVMTTEEKDTDGMCSTCAGYVTEEMRSDAAWCHKN